MTETPPDKYTITCGKREGLRVSKGDHAFQPRTMASVSADPSLGCKPLTEQGLLEDHSWMGFSSVVGVSRKSPRRYPAPRTVVIRRPWLPSFLRSDMIWPFTEWSVAG